MLLIQGDDDRNVQFQQTVDLAARLHAQHVPYEELVLPDEIHGFLRWSPGPRPTKRRRPFSAREPSLSKRRAELKPNEKARCCHRAFRISDAEALD